MWSEEQWRNQAMHTQLLSHAWFMLGTTASRTNREVSTGRCSTFLIFKCIVLANTRHILTRGEGKSQRLNLLLQLTFFFFSQSHRVGGPETMNRLPRPWNCTHACVTRWNEHLLWLSGSSHRPPAAKHWNRSHVGQTSQTNGRIENQGGIMQFWQINVPI